MKFIHGKNIQLALREVLPTTIAVAYVGADWADYIDSSRLKEIVLSPTLGTNPSAIVGIAKKIGWNNVHFLDNLHSKIYLGAELAAVGSFNLTANGLSAEGLEEAGFVVEDQESIAELRHLVESYKTLAVQAYPTPERKLERLAWLREIWDRAAKHGVIRNDAKSRALADYLPAASDEIYVCWVQGTITFSEQVLSPATVNNSVSFLQGDDVKADRWILCWHIQDSGYPDERFKPYWLHIDEVIADGAVETIYEKVAIERNDREAIPPPFDLTKSTIFALRAVLKSDRFPEFLAKTDRWSINPTLPLLPAFIKAMQEEVSAAAQSGKQVDSGPESLREIFSSRIREAMDIARDKGILSTRIDGMLKKQHAVELAKKLVQSGSEAVGLKNLARANALMLSFESIMLEEQFQALFSKDYLDCARFNLSQIK